MKQIMCSKCGIRPAVIFMTRMDGDKSSKQEGLCLKCAMESTGPIKQMMENMGITEDDYEAMSEQFGAMMGDTQRVYAYMTAYAKVAMKNHNYPLYNSDAAKVCMAAYDIIQMAK